MSTSVASHRVDVPDDEREQAFQEKREVRSTHQSPYSHVYQPAGGAYWNPYVYMSPPLPHPYPYGAGPIVPESPQHAPQHGQVALPHTYGQAPHPHFLAVNVHTDNHQHQSQKQAAQNSQKQISVKEKVIQTATRGLEQLLDARVLAAGLATFLLPKIVHHIQPHKRKKRGLFLEFGLA